MNMYVMRLAKGHEGGLLHGACPVNYETNNCLEYIIENYGNVASCDRDGEFKD